MLHCHGQVSGPWITGML
ncbi:rCG32307 [Rattus norvegicus]|uniref:RCG32307 n=1 Tax=Rattus norvegicus TaxID=10116 RepID=A6JXH0_RAT|nr:rCG32307 [Rattus norvegicus]